MPSTTGTTAVTGSAERWGRLWGARPADWALSEDQQTPTHEATLERVDLKAGQAVLEIGCGAGSFLRLVTKRGARAFGLDASQALIEFAQARLPRADLRVGEMEVLPYQDDSFDLVCGFNSFFFANDILAAIREAGRVARPGALVVIQVWGRTSATTWRRSRRCSGPTCRPARRTPQPSPTTRPVASTKQDAPAAVLRTCISPPARPSPPPAGRSSTAINPE